MPTINSMLADMELADWRRARTALVGRILATAAEAERRGWEGHALEFLSLAGEVEATALNEFGYGVRFGGTPKFRQAYEDRYTALRVAWHTERAEAGLSNW